MGRNKHPEQRGFNFEGENAQELNHDGVALGDLLNKFEEELDNEDEEL